MSWPNAKRKFEEDEDDDVRSTGVQNPNKRARCDKYEVRLLLPTKVVGSIMGWGGANIKKLCADSNADIDVSDVRGPEQVMTVETEHEDNLLAVIEQSLPLMTEEAVNKGRKINRFGVQHVSCVCGLTNKPLEVRLLVHQSLIGGIIGKDGWKVKDICDESKAEVEVFKTAAPWSTDQCVSLLGSPQEILIAIKQVFSMILHTKTKGMIQHYDPINFDILSADEYGGYGTETDIAGRVHRRGAVSRACSNRMGLTATRGGGFRGLTATRGGGFRVGSRNNGGGGRGGFGGAGFQQDDNWGGRGRFSGTGFQQDVKWGGRGPFGGAGFQQDDNWGGRGPFGGAGFKQELASGSKYLKVIKGNHRDVADWVKETCEFLILQKNVGAILGPRGHFIQRIQAESRCKIRIRAKEEGSNRRIITIVGTQNQIQLAQCLLQQSVREHGGRHQGDSDSEDGERGWGPLASSREGSEDRSY